MPKHTVAIQTSPIHNSATKQLNVSLVEDIRPAHFSAVQTSKLEDAFRQNTKPDIVTIHILAMESNLLYQDVQAWFKARRMQWLVDADRSNQTKIKSIEGSSESKVCDGSLPDIQC